MGNARTPCANARTHPRALARTQARTHARTRPPACAHTGDQSKAQQNQDIPSGPVDKQGAVWPGWVIDILFLLNVAGISYAGGRQGGEGGGGSSRLLVHRRGHARHLHAKVSVTPDIARQPTNQPHPIPAGAQAIKTGSMFFHEIPFHPNDQMALMLIFGPPIFYAMVWLIASSAAGKAAR